MQQLELFERNFYKIKKPIRLIEMFGGIGSQAMALRDIGANFESWRLIEFDKYPVKSYNAIHGTNYEPSDIRNIHAEDLEIVDTDKYCYLLTYSFPCQDLSVAGSRKGCSRSDWEKGKSTRSGLLWEVERILNECEELQKRNSRYGLPEVLLMENVPQICGANMDDFQLWIDFLRSKKYTCGYKVLNAKSFNVPQNRERCFMVSIQGQVDYEFPEGEGLKCTVNDYLEDSVDEKYYLNPELTSNLIKNTEQLRQTDRQTDRQILAQLHKNSSSGELQKLSDSSLYNINKDYCGTIVSRYYKGIGGAGDNVILEK